MVTVNNSITWEEKFAYDLKYIENVTFWSDLILILKTIGKVFKRENTVREGTVSDIDYGDCLLNAGKITKEEYEEKQNWAKEMY